MKKAILSVLFGLLSLSAIAQWPREESLPLQKQRYERGGGIYVIVPNYTNSQNIQINSILHSNEYPMIPYGGFNYGVGLTWRLNRFELGAEAMMGNQSRTRADINSRITRNTTTVNIPLKYHLVIKEKYSVFVLSGWSGTQTNLTASKPVTNTSNINSLLLNPGTSVQLEHLSTGLLLGGGIAIHRLQQDFTGGFIVKFGYRLPFHNGFEWESRFAQFTNSPIDNFSYFFLQFEIGIFSNYKKGELKPAELF